MIMFLNAPLLTSILKLMAILLISIPLSILAKPNEIMLSDDKIKHLLIQESILAYPGNCPCPYHLDRAGRKCGKRSAWSRSGGYAPLCCPSDVTPKMIEKYRKKMEKQSQ